MFINIHTHKKDESNLHILNILANDGDVDFNTMPYFSIGLHPWHVNSNFNTIIKKIEEIALHKKCLAIGEIGLDKLHKNTWTEQNKALEKQIIIAIKLKKPIIFHCVKCYSELAQLLSKIKPKIPLIFHAFNENIQVAKMFKNFDSYFSFGHLLLNSNTKAYKNFHLISPNSIFFETDDANIDIKEIYLQASKINGMSVEQWEQQIEKNFSKIFKL